MLQPLQYSFSRYLSSKRSVDDRALNQHVRHTLAHELQAAGPDTPVSVLEIGAGTGIMIERLLEWELLCAGHYTALDLSAENIAEARRRLPKWAAEHDYRFFQHDDGDMLFANQNQTLHLHLEATDLFDFIARRDEQRWDLLVAHAFLDLIDIPAALPRLFRLLQPGGLFYFTINFDGETVLEPAIDAAFDAHVMALYHRTMDERTINGRPSGDSHSGRRLFGHLAAAGGTVLAAGASDWVVHPLHGIYPEDEAYFLHFIIHTIQGALTGHPELDPPHFASWIAARHAQVDHGELVYIAHQLDFAGRVAS